MLWFGGKPKHLPLSTGPFVPGCTDIMLDYDKNGLFLRLFYPSTEQYNENWKKWVPWIPNSTYLDGISRVLKFPMLILRFVFWWYGSFYIPAIYGAKVKFEKNMKCVILSHGLGGSRFIYSKIATDLASHGFLVACLEHRDRSACHTYFYATEKDAKVDNKTIIDFEHVPMGENHYLKRNTQIRYRSSECIKTIEFFKKLNNSIIPENILDKVENRTDYNFRLDDLVGNIDVNNFTLMGHSFGAATVLYTIPQTTDIKQSILLDPWMFPIKEENLHEKIDVPLLFINTQTFHIDTNVKAMAKFMGNKNREMYTICKSTHENQTDSVLVSRYWLNIFMEKIDPYVGINVNNALILRYLNKYINVPENIEQYEKYLNKNSQWFEEGLTKPWKRQ